MVSGENGWVLCGVAQSFNEVICQLDILLDCPWIEHPNIYQQFYKEVREFRMGRTLSVDSNVVLLWLSVKEGEGCVYPILQDSFLNQLNGVMAKWWRSLPSDYCMCSHGGYSRLTQQSANTVLGLLRA